MNTNLGGPMRYIREALKIFLPKNDQSTTTQPGDVILYQGNSITIYYGTNTWSFTRLGKIEIATREGLLQALGDGDMQVTFSLTPAQN